MRETSGAGVWTRRAALGRRVVHPPRCTVMWTDRRLLLRSSVVCRRGPRPGPGRQVRKESMRVIRFVLTRFFILFNTRYAPGPRGRRVGVEGTPVNRGRPRGRPAAGRASHGAPSLCSYSARWLAAPDSSAALGWEGLFLLRSADLVNRTVRRGLGAAVRVWCTRTTARQRRTRVMRRLITADASVSVSECCGSGGPAQWPRCSHDGVA